MGGIFQGSIESLPFASSRDRNTPYFWPGFFIVIAIYAAVCGALLLVSDGLPYVLDNNETFSSIIHARNLFEQGIGGSFGLTDESYGRTDESHPYLYTHQGNFPRIFALLIYVLGAHSAEAQIFITTLTIGVAGISLAYTVVARRAGWLIGVFFCLLMITDYLMVTQWQLNTWRVWHMLFFFLALLCVDRAAESKNRLWFILLFFVHLALFYYELAFAAYLAATTTFYAAFRSPFRAAFIVKTLVAQTTGMLASIGILCAQLLAYFGWDNFLTDLKLTFLARNESMDAAARAATEHFMSEHKIVFWYNINEFSGLRQVDFMLERIFSLTLGFYTPALISAAVIISVSIAIRVHLTDNRFLSSPESPRTIPTAIGKQVVCGMLAAYLFSVIGGFGVAAFSSSNIGATDSAILAVAALIMIGDLATRVQKVSRGDRMPLSAFSRSALAVGVALAWFYSTEPFYVSLGPHLGNLTGVWDSLSDTIGSLAIQLLLLISGWTAARIALGASGDFTDTVVARCARLISLPISGFLAFAVVYFLSPGYVLSGYLNRFVPLVTFAALIPITISFVVVSASLLQIADISRRPWWRALRYRAPIGVNVRPMFFKASRESAIALLCVAACGILPMLWGMIQKTNFERLPPNQFAFLSILSEPSFRGASFVVNNYAAPVAVATGNWAYYDPEFGNLRIDRSGDKPKITRDLRYLWLADRGSNPSYAKPDYFLCIIPRDILAVVRPFEPISDDCGRLPIIRDVGREIPGLLTTELFAKDSSPQMRWAIVRLHWHDAKTDSPANHP